MSNINNEFEDQFKQMFAAMLGQMEQLKTKGPRSASKYRLWLKIKDQEALYEDPAIIAALLTKGFQGVPDQVTDEDLASMAKLLVDLTNDLYTAILEDCQSDKSLANKVFKEIVRNG